MYHEQRKGPAQVCRHLRRYRNPSSSVPTFRNVCEVRLIQYYTSIRQRADRLAALRYDPPTPGAPTLTHSIPAGVPFVFPNPLPHIFRLLAAPALSRSMSVRLLAPSDSPSCGSFIASDFFVPGAKDQLGEACSQLILQLGKLNRTTVLGWEEKESFLTFYQSKTS